MLLTPKMLFWNNHISFIYFSYLKHQMIFYFGVFLVNSNTFLLYDFQYYFSAYIFWNLRNQKLKKIIILTFEWLWTILLNQIWQKDMTYVNLGKCTIWLSIFDEKYYLFCKIILLVKSSFEKFAENLLNH